MIFWQILFWSSCFLVIYNYAGYAVIAAVLNKLGKKNKKRTGSIEFYPSVSFIVAAYNERDCIDQKVLNSLQQVYPADKLEIIFVTDGSNDGTQDIISTYPGVRVLHNAERKGKSAAMNRAVTFARNEILIFSDSNTILNDKAVAFISRHYADPRTGGVAGEKKVMQQPAAGTDVGDGEGLYWKYESALKMIDSDFHSVVGAAGELFSLRRDLFEPLGDEIILDDFVLSMKTAQKGYRIIYEPDACAMELPSFSIGEEQKRKVRIAAGGFQSIRLLYKLLYFWKQPRLSFLYISHRVLRWTLSPLCLLLALVANIILVAGTNLVLYRWVLGAQVLFYLMALLASIITKKTGLLKILNVPYYFVFMNISVYQGFFRYLKGSQSAVWEKAKRATQS